MKKLIGMVFTAACLAVNSWSGAALADERCSIGFDGQTPEAFAAEYIAGEILFPPTLIRTLEEMIGQGCDDHASFDAVIAAFSNPAALVQYRRLEPDAWKIDRSTLADITMLALLDHNELPRRLISLLEDRAQAGSPEAMTSLGVLGSVQMSDWSASRRSGTRLKVSMIDFSRRHERIISYFKVDDRITSSEHPLQPFLSELSKNPQEYMKEASDLGFAPAHIFRLTGEFPQEFSPCTMPSDFAEMFSSLPERERIAEGMIGWSRGIIEEAYAEVRSLLHDEQITEPLRDLRLAFLRNSFSYGTNRTAARDLAFVYAGMRSNCLFSIEDDEIDFGIKNQDKAELGLRLAMIAPGSLSEKTKYIVMIFLWFADQSHTERERHYALARILHYPGWVMRGTGWTSIRNRFIERLSRETIKEAQLLMQRRGFYEAAIDGIPGSAFYAGLPIWHNYCVMSSAGREDSEVCMINNFDLYLAEWARPFLHDPLGLQ